MKKIKLFYSYSRIDESDRKTLEKHLATLRCDGFIDEWHDKKIDAGDNWNEEIEKNMAISDIILLLFSSDFIASKFCQKEVEAALKLRKEKNTIVIPIILRQCSWTDFNRISVIQVLPNNGKAISTWTDKDEGWVNVYEGIKKNVEKIRSSITPTLKDDFKTELLKNPIENCSLEKLFVFPDILKTSENLKQKLENNEIDSDKLKNLESFKDRYILLEGEEQSGKTSMCNMLYIHYIDAGFYPVLLEGRNITGTAEIEKKIQKQFYSQYESTIDYWTIEKEKRILLIDDVDESDANPSNLSSFIASIPEYFKFSIVFIDKLFNLSDRSTEKNHFAFFENYSIRHLGHKKRNEIIKKCIALDEQIEFDSNNTDQLARLDKNTKHINTIIGSNIVPSNPLFIVTIFHTVETVGAQDLSQTSYGHCYHAIITLNLGRAGIKAEDIDSCFNFLTELAYFIFNAGSKIISVSEFSKFTGKYKEEYVFQKDIVKILTRANILRKKDDSYSFQYIYIYYYFVAKYIAQKMDDENLKIRIEKLMSNIHMKDNANIIIFITHHTNNKILLNDITISATSTFDKFPESTLSGKEKNFIKDPSANLGDKNLPDSTHSIDKEREEKLDGRDKLAPVIEQIEEDQENNPDPLLIEIRKSAKCMEIIGQILKNNYGSLRRPRLEELFEEGQNVGLRLLRSFIVLMTTEREGMEELIQSRIGKIKKKDKELSKAEREKETQKFLAYFSYSIIFGWLSKIVDSLGYDKLIGIADSVNNKTNTVASKLINLSIHTWHVKRLDINKIKALHREFEDDKNYQAIYLLKDIVSRHIYMHPIKYQDKQKINSILGFPLARQEVMQKKLKFNLKSSK